MSEITVLCSKQTQRHFRSVLSSSKKLSILCLLHTNVCLPIVEQIQQIQTSSGVRRKFPRGEKFRHNRVTSKINFGEVPKARPFSGGPGACPRENFAKLHLKIRSLCILEASFSIMLLRDLLADETEN